MYALLGAKTGCLSAEAALGYCLLTGCGVAKDEARGSRLVKASASAFCASGMYVAGCTRVVLNNDDEVLHHFHFQPLSASAVHARPIVHRYALGAVLERGIGCERDEYAAYKSYKSAAMLGNAAAQYSCAVLQSRSHGCSPRQAAQLNR